MDDRQRRELQRQREREHKELRGKFLKPEIHIKELRWILGGLAAACVTGLYSLLRVQTLSTAHWWAATSFAVAIPMLVATAYMVQREQAYELITGKAVRRISRLPGIIGMLAGYIGIASLFYGLNFMLGTLFLGSTMLAAVFALDWHEFALLKSLKEQAAKTTAETKQPALDLKSSIAGTLPAAAPPKEAVVVAQEKPVQVGAN